MPKSLLSTPAVRSAPTTPRLVWLIGPALVAGVAYLDPGNVASNMTAGAKFGYLLVWVVVVGNVMAWLIQYLSAKLGIVTGRSLPETLGTRIRNPWARRAYWLQAELVAMATDIAEVIGGAVALNLLFGVPLVWGGVITGTVSIALLLLQSRRGARTFEFVVIGLVAIIAIGFTFGVFVGPPDPAEIAAGLVPRFEGTDSVLLAASILGATIMPHAIYAHSRARARPLRPGGRKRQRARADPGTRARTTARTADASAPARDALGCHDRDAHRRDGEPVHPAARRSQPRRGARHRLARGRLRGPARRHRSARRDALRGRAARERSREHVGRRLRGGRDHARPAAACACPLLVRRLVTLLPALAILAVGVDPTLALVLSQVVLSFGIPFALIPLVALTAKRDVLGEFRNRLGTTLAGVAASVFLIALNGVLLWLLLSGA